MRAWWGSEPRRDDATHDRVRPAVLVRHPAFPAAVCFIAGIALHDQLPVAGWMWVGFAACYATAALLTRNAAASCACVALALAALGAAAGQSARFYYPAGEIGLYAGDAPRLAWLDVYLPQTPDLLRTAEAGLPRPPKLTTVAGVVAVKTLNGWQPATGQTLLQIDTPDPRLRAGQTVRVFGTLERPGAAMNPGQFDYAAYYRARRTLASVSVDGPGNVAVLADPGPPPLTRLRDAARAWLVAGFPAQQWERAALLRTILLGERDPAMSDVRDTFRKSGTSHYLAVSGLHVAVVGGFAFFIVRLFGAGPRLGLLCVGGVVGLYALLAVPSPPVLRAVVLSLAFGLGLAGRRRATGIHLLAVAAVVVLWFNPLDLYRAGFQLSFATVLGLMLLANGVVAALDRQFDREGKSDLRLEGEPWVVRWAYRLDKRLVAGVSAGVAAWLVAMPLVALHFEQFNPWAIPASLCAGPFVLLSLVGGMVKIGLTAALPQGATLWATLAGWPVAAMQWTVAWFAALPGADIPLPAPPLVLVAFFYGALLLWRVPWPTAGARWAARGPLAAAALMLFVLPFTGGANAALTTAAPSPGTGPLTVTLLAVGAGQCAAIETPAGRIALVDVGSTSLGDPVGKCLAPFLRDRGHTRVDLVALSHANWDHYGGAPAVARRYGVGDVIVDHQFPHDARAAASGRDLLDELADLDRPPRLVAAGDVIPLGRDTALRILWPPADARDLEANDASLVLKLEHAGRGVLFTGDIQGEAMTRLLALNKADPSLLRADVLVAPHHGSSEPVTPAFVEAVAPTWVVASNGRTQSQKQVRFLTMLAGRPLLRTSDVGAITVTLDEDRVTASGFLGASRPGLRYAE